MGSVRNKKRICITNCNKTVWALKKVKSVWKDVRVSDWSLKANHSNQKIRAQKDKENDD